MIGLAAVPKLEFEGVKALKALYISAKSGACVPLTGTWTQNLTLVASILMDKATLEGILSLCICNGKYNWICYPESWVSGTFSYTEKK